MRGTRRPGGLILPLWLIVVAAGCQQLTLPRGDPEDLIATSRKYFEEGNYRQASRYGRAVTFRHEDAPEAPEGYFLEAESRRLLREGDAAFEAYQRLADKFPNSRFAADAATGQFELGHAYLAGEMPGFLFFSASRGAGVKILEHMQVHNRNHDKADDALIEVAEYQLGEEDYDLASETLRRLLREYPSRQHTLRARYQLARALYAQSSGPDYDEKVLLDAKSAFNDFLATAEVQGAIERFPDQIESARKLLTVIDEALAHKQYRIGRFYERTDQPDAAIHYYEYCLTNYPGTPYAEECRQRIAKIRKDAR